MNEWPQRSGDDDLERADDLLGQADALLRRHRGLSDIEAQPPGHAQDPGPAFDDDDDLPILTEIVDDLELPAAWPEPKPAESAPASIFHPPPAATSAPPAATVDPGAHRAELTQHLAEQLVELDTEIARKVADWVAVELQQVLDRELAQLGARLHAEMLAQLRATLLPDISSRISALLDDTVKAGATPERP